MDFTIKTYKSLLQILMEKKYLFLSFQEYIQKKYSIQNSNLSFVILRHDVDRLPQNALRMAQLEAQMNIKSTYFFRVINKTFKSNIIKKIAELGHEIGYHYENLSTVSKQIKNKKYKTNHNNKYINKLFEYALEDFKMKLKELRKFYPVKTISMHGSPLSKYDNRDLWKKYDYKNEEIIGEPYFDVDFNNILYITDASREWNNENINKRDKVNNKFKFTFNHTNDIILGLRKNILPDKIMINIHPEFWANNTVEWYRIFLYRKIRNTIKKIFLKYTNN